MSIDFNIDRSPALDLALNTGAALQKAISSGKHGNVGNVKGILSIKEILSATKKNVRTIGIHLNSAEDIVAYNWYRRSTITVADIYHSMNYDSSTGHYVINLQVKLMHLYVVTLEEIIDSLRNCVKGKDVFFKYYYSAKDIVCILLTDLICDICNYVVRKTSLDCTPSDWNIYVRKDIVYTIFKGDKYRNVFDLCDHTLSTNVNITVSFMGKINSAIIYKIYTDDNNVNLYLAKMLYSSKMLADNYSTMCKDSGMKRLTLREQQKHMLELVEKKAVDNLTTKESALIVGLSLED